MGGMVMCTRGGGLGSGSGSGAGIEPMDEQTQDFISSEITRNILEQNPVIFGLVKERIIEILDERMGTLRTEIWAIVWAHTLSFCKFRACGAPEFFGEKDPIASRRWLAGMVNAFLSSFYPVGLNGWLRIMNLHSHLVEEFIIVGTTIGIRQDKPWCYQSCPDCHVKAVEIPDGNEDVKLYKCTNVVCNKSTKIHYSSLCTRRFCFYNLNYCKLHEWSICFRLGFSLSIYPLEHNFLKNKHLAFKVSVTKYNVRFQNSVYTI
uniref:Uncharacterized protein n=1 Tax=Lactuca sativa TaxID=4236 RepID=A0A9R1XJE9_LACSA|nr:hypothetical protein LSAT_V11C300113410 [Lactuca sativa]